MNAPDVEVETVPRRGVGRLAWAGLGLVCVGIGGIGIVVPGLPTTIFFICAAACFSRSSPRLEAWVLGLPRIGPAIVDYRAGLGMPRKAKIAASVMIVTMVGLSAWLIDSWLIRAIVLGVGAVGVGFVLRQPTKQVPPVDGT